MLFFKEFSQSMRNYENGLEASNLFEKLHFSSLNWYVPVSVAILYAVIVTIWGRCNKAKAAAASLKAKKTSSSTVGSQTSNTYSPFNLLVIAHNINLTVFSAYCFVCIVPILINAYMTRPAFDAFCDVGFENYNNGISYLMWLFYISKYYELLDTVILLLKGKPSSFLQTFHHSGSILSLWTMVTSRIPGMWLFTFLNSFIHTIMYVYYTLTCLGYRPTWKKLLTSMQLTQFFIGNVIGIIYLIIPNCYDKSSVLRENILQRLLGSNQASIIFTYIYNYAFVGSLIYLFNDFSRRTYGVKKAADESSTTSLSGEVAKKEKASHKKREPKAKKDKAAAVAAAVVETVPVKEKKRINRKTASPIQEATSIDLDASSTTSIASKKSRAVSKSRGASKSRARPESRSKSKVRRAESPVKSTTSTSTSTASVRRKSSRV